MNYMNIEELLMRVQKPGRYLGTEVNAVHKPPEAVRVQLALAFPDLYEVAMSHLGLKILYGVVNRMAGVHGQRVFTPDNDMEHLLREKNLPLFSLEGRLPLHQFDLVGFTLQYELSYTAILNMLQLGHIPLRSRDRNRQHPFILGGGPGAFNPEPLAPFFDAFVIGDGEEALVEIIERYRHWKDEGPGEEEGPRGVEKDPRGVEKDPGLEKGLELDNALREHRASFLRSLMDLPGIYIPSFYKPTYSGHTYTGLKKLEPGAPDVIEKRTARNLENLYYPDSFIVPYIDVVHDRAVLELFRGCSRGCRFCQAGVIYRPVRERSLERLVDLAEHIVKNTGFEELSLSSLSSSDYSCISQLVDELDRRFAGKNLRLSLPSLRANPFSVRLAHRIQKGKAAGVTFAPEAGSQRLRNVINKQVTEEDILEAAAEAINSGRNHIKLYFMLGLPTETEEDLLEMGELTKKILHLRRKGQGRGMHFKVSVSVSTFVPKAHTPFQWELQLPLSDLKNRQETLRRIFKPIKGAQFNWHDAEMSVLEAVFSRGDRRLAPVLEKALDLGARREAWDDQFVFSRWLEAFRAVNVDPEYFAGFHPGYDDPLPWDHINPGMSKEFLIQEHRRAIKEQATPDCRINGCKNCGLPHCPVRQVKENAPL